MKAFIFMIIFLLSSSVYSQQGKWEQIDSLTIERGTQYKKIVCPDSLHCIAACNNNMVWPCMNVTTDGGKSWQITLLDTAGEYYYNGRLKDAAYPDTNFAIVVCDSGKYWISYDKGQSWNKHYLDSSGATLSVYFCDHKNGVISNRTTGVFKPMFTTDGGINWITKNINPIENEITKVYADKIFMINKKISYAIAYGSDKDTTKYYLVKTIDGGNNWTWYPRFYDEYNKIRYPVDAIRDIYFFNEDTGFVLSSPKVNTDTYKDIIYKTTDGGNTWRKVLDTLMPKPINQWVSMYFSFADKRYGIAYGYNKFFRTSDGGDSWKYDTSFQTFQWNLPGDYINAAAMPTPNVIYAAEFQARRIFKWTADKNVSVNEIQTNTDNIKLYPNPTLGSVPFNIEFELSESAARASFRLYDELGAERSPAFEEFLPPGRHIIKYTPSERLPRGMYYVKIIINNKTEVKPLAVQ